MAVRPSINVVNVFHKVLDTFKSRDKTMKTFSKHVKYRVENKEIFICFCKELLDFKIDIKYLPLIQNIQRGLNTEILDNNDKILIEELNRFGGLIELQIKP